MTLRSSALNIAKFLGVNRRDGADLVADNEFTTLQNWYPKTKGLFYRKEGSIPDLVAADIPLCSEIVGLYRYYDMLGKRSTLYYCRAASTTIEDPVDNSPNFTKVVNASGTGDLVTGSNSFFISYVGRGLETAEKILWTTSLPTSTNSVTITHDGTPFPTGVQSINLYIRDPNNFLPGFVGVFRAPGDAITVRAPWISQSVLLTNQAKPHWCELDGNLNYSIGMNDGNLQPGTYYISVCWNGMPFLNPGTQAPLLAYKEPDSTFTDQYLTVVVPFPNSSIKVAVRSATGNDGNGASYCHFFVGLKKPSQVPMQWVGTRKCLTANPALSSPEVISITDIPTGSNAQASPTYDGQLGTTGSNLSFFDPTLSLFTWGIDTRFPSDFVIKQDSDGTLHEILFSGSCRLNMTMFNALTRGAADPGFNGTGYTHAYTLYGQLFGSRHQGVSFQDFTGLCFIANSVNLLLQTDGFGLYETVADVGTVQPGMPTGLEVLKSQLCVMVKNSEIPVVVDSKNRDQVFATNALNPYNWAPGGTGTDLRFVTIGTGFSDGLTAIAVFNFNSATDGPNSFLAAFKRSSTTLVTNIADEESAISGSVNGISGRTGCIASDTITATNMGLMFLGSDGDIYMIMSTGGEPRRIGNRIRPILEHLAVEENATLMYKATACFHKGFFKISYPSSPTSTTNDAELWADLRTEQNTPITWSGPHKGANIGPQIVFLGEGDPEIRIAAISGQPATAVMNVDSTFQDLGVSYPAVIEWKTSRMKNMLNLKRYIGIFLDLYYDTQFAHEIKLEAFCDGQYSQQNRVLSTGTGVWDASNFDQGNWGDSMFFAVNILFGPSNLIGRTMRWRLTHENNAQMVLAGANIIFNPERRMIVDA